MELPNYFLADLADRSTLTPQLVTDACQTLKQNRKKFLATHTTDSLISILVKLGREWLDPQFLFRAEVLNRGPEQTGFTRETLTSGLDRFFSQLTRENLERLVIQDLGSLRRLDEVVADEIERKEDRSSIAHGPELLVHFTGGVLPNAPFMSIILGLLARSAQFVKCASGTAFLPRMFAHSLYSIQPKLGACIEIAEWKGGTTHLEEALFNETNCVTGTGSDESLTEIRMRLPSRVRFIGYGHKLSLAFITLESLNKNGAEKLAANLADDVTAWNQLGCLSPHAVYIESGAAIDSIAFAEILSQQLATRENTEPRGTVSPETAAAITSRRMFYEVRASAQGDAKVYTSPGSTAWTVIHDSSPQFQPSCLNRFVFVKPVDSFEDFLANIGPVQGDISTVGLAASLPRAQEINLRLARAGVTRICRLGQMQNPPLTWRHDGRPSLAELITWTDIEL